MCSVAASTIENGFQGRSGGVVAGAPRGRDLRAGGASQRGRGSLAGAGRGIRPAGGLGGVGVPVVHALAVVPLRAEPGGGARPGARGAPARRSAAAAGGVWRRRAVLFAGARDHARGDGGQRGRAGPDRQVCDGGAAGDGGARLSWRARGRAGRRPAGLPAPLCALRARRRRRAPDPGAAAGRGGRARVGGAAGGPRRAARGRRLARAGGRPERGGGRRAERRPECRSCRGSVERAGAGSAELAAGGDEPAVAGGASAEATHIGDSAAGSVGCVGDGNAELAAAGSVEPATRGGASAEATHIGDSAGAGSVACAGAASPAWAANGSTELAAAGGVEPATRGGASAEATHIGDSGRGDHGVCWRRGRRGGRGRTAASSWCTSTRRRSRTTVTAIAGSRAGRR
jgi:hypothetical protein